MRLIFMGPPAFSVSALAALRDAPFDDLIDVRSPAEFAEDHLPGAINLPVLSNEERARVGTMYVRESRFGARKIGAALVLRNTAHHIETALADRSGAWQPLVYCWRGGLRSGAFASILTQIGWRVEVLEGGYRSYRRQVVAAVHDQPIAPQVVVLDGNTGTAKPAFLELLSARGHQVLDLEAAAAHRGSVFGSRPGGQPSQKAFEGRLAMDLARMDPHRPVLVEAESSKIGEVQLPPSLWAAMRAAPRIRLSVPIEARAAYLVEAYGDIVDTPEVLCEPLEALRPHQGAARIEAWQALATEGAFRQLAAELMLAHYDPRYAKSRGRHSAPANVDLDVASLDAGGLALGADQSEAALRQVSLA